MSDTLLLAVQGYVEANIGSFHEKRLDTVREKQLNDVLSRKNPYLFRAKSPSVTRLITGIMDAFLSSQEEGLFGNFLEGVAVFVARQVFGGYKPEPADLTGIDLVFEKRGAVYMVDIKSGPNWGNSSQVTRMRQNFRDGIGKLQPQFPDKPIIPVNGCMYGKDRKPRKTGRFRQDGVAYTIEYWKLCGQDFWHLISDNPQMYVEIIKPLGYRARKRNMAFQAEYDSFLNRLLREFLNTYANDDGSIAWDRLTEFVSLSPNEDTVRAVAENANNLRLE